MSATPSLGEPPRIGVPFALGGKVFVLCRDCHKLVRIDKPILGSLHVCTEKGAAR